MARTAVLTKEMILEAAFNLMNQSGPDSITIRGIAQYLHKSTAPIYTQYSGRDALMTDLESYVNAKLKAETQKERTIDGFKNIGLGLIDFTLKYKSVFAYYYLAPETSLFSHLNKEDMLDQMKANGLLTVLKDEQLLQMLDDMWVYTYGLTTMICTGIETSDSLDYYHEKLNRMGHKVISYYLYSSGQYEAYIQQIMGKVAQHIDIEEVFRP